MKLLKQSIRRTLASALQHQPKVPGDRVSEQQHAPNIIEDTPDIGGVGQPMQHEICIKPTAAVAIDTAAGQKGTEHNVMAHPDPDPDPDPDRDRTASEASLAAARDSNIKDLPTTGDDNASPMEDTSHNEDILVDDIVASILTQCH